MRSQRIFIASAWAAGVFSAVATYAQVPPSVQPGSIERQISAPPSRPADAPVINVPAARTDKVPSNAGDIRFLLRSVRVTGARSLDLEELAALWQTSVGNQVSLTEVFAWTRILTERLRDRGYLLAEVIIPAQEIRDGNVELTVVEGFVDKIEVRDSEGGSAEDLQRYVEAIRRERPLTARTLERQVLLLNELGGIQARAYLRASETQGASDLVIVAQRRPYSGSLGIDSRVSHLLGKSQLDASLNIYDLSGHHETHTVRAVSSESADLFLLGYSAELPIGADGLKLLGGVSKSRTLPQVVSLPNLRTDSTSGSLLLSYPLIRSRELNFAVRGGFAGFDSRTAVAGLVSDAYRLRTVKLGAAFDGTDGWSGVNLGDVEITTGLRGAGARDDMNMPGDDRRFQKLALYAARLQSLAPSWSLLVAGTAQASDRPLLASERFGLGGAQFLRAYDGSELLGDTGGAIKLEVRRNVSLRNASFTGYAFAERGIVHIRSASAVTRADAASDFGLGVRGSLVPRINGYVEVAKPWGRDVASRGNRGARLAGGLSINF